MFLHYFFRILNILFIWKKQRILQRVKSQRHMHHLKNSAGVVWVEKGGCYYSMWFFVGSSTYRHNKLITKKLFYAVAIEYTHNLFLRICGSHKGVIIIVLVYEIMRAFPLLSFFFFLNHPPLSCQFKCWIKRVNRWITITLKESVCQDSRYYRSWKYIGTKVDLWI